jgi:VanZ family protein
MQHWLPLTLWLAVIHLFSTDAFSASNTSGVFVPLMRFFFPGISSEAIAFWHAVFRKTGHVTEYFALGVLAFRAFRNEIPRLTPTAVLTMAFVLVVALSDEFHQTLTLSRTGSLVDVGYDCAGAVAALWLFTQRELRRSAS